MKKDKSVDLKEPLQLIRQSWNLKRLMNREELKKRKMILILRCYKKGINQRCWEILIREMTRSQSNLLRPLKNIRKL